MVRRLLLFALLLTPVLAHAEPSPPKVSVIAAGDTGTMHYADRVTIGDGAHALTLKLPDDAIEKGKDLLPLFSSRILRAAADRFVLIGWSSMGSGMQTMHAWIVKTAPSASPVIVDRLALTTDRASAGLVIDTKNGVRIGVPWTFDGTLHDADDWSLKVGGRTRSLPEMKSLSFTTESGKLDSYRAPIAQAPFADTRVAWLKAEATGFK